jgi:hypothetical protein
MTKLYYFRVAFISLTIGITVGLFVYDLLGVLFFDDPISIGNIALRSLFVGFFTGLILGLLNMYFKIFPFKQRDN